MLEALRNTGHEIELRLSRIVVGNDSVENCWCHKIFRRLNADFLISDYFCFSQTERHSDFSLPEYIR